MGDNQSGQKNAAGSNAGQIPFLTFAALRKMMPGSETAFMRYVGDGSRTVAEWIKLYAAFMSQPTEKSKKEGK